MDESGEIYADNATLWKDYHVVQVFVDRYIGVISASFRKQMAEVLAYIV